MKNEKCDITECDILPLYSSNSTHTDYVPLYKIMLHIFPLKRTGNAAFAVSIIS